MTKILTIELIQQKTKCYQLYRITNINLWGNDIEDISVLTRLPNLEVVSLSVNQIKSLKSLANKPKLKQLYLRNNKISDFGEIAYLKACPNLEVLWLCENPISQSPNYRVNVISMLPQLKVLDNRPITEAERYYMPLALEQSPSFRKYPSSQRVMQRHNSCEYYDCVNKDLKMSGTEHNFYMKNQYNYNNTNIMNCLIMLLDELNANELDYILQHIDKKISEI